MTVTACTLAALLIFEAASAPAKDACELTDDRCKAALYERRAVTAAAADHRAQYLFNAHNLYVRLFDKTGNPRDLCSARRAIEASLAIDDQPETLRSASEALRTQLLARAKQQRARCASKTKRRVAPVAAPLLARSPVTKPAQEPSPETSEPDPPNTAAATEPTTTSHDSTPTTVPAPPHKLTLLADPDTASSTQPADGAPLPVAAPQVDVPPASTLRPGRGLVIAGGVTFGVGAALAVGAGLVSRRMSDTRQEIIALHERFDRYATDDQVARDAELRGDYQAQQQQRLALALGSGATIVVAMILAGVGGRRLARAASRTAFITAGLVFRLRF